MKQKVLTFASFQYSIGRRYISSSHGIIATEFRGKRSIVSEGNGVKSVHMHCFLLQFVSIYVRKISHVRKSDRMAEKFSELINSTHERFFGIVV